MPKISTSQYGELTESEFDLEQPTSTHLRRRSVAVIAAVLTAAGLVHGGMVVYQKTSSPPVRAIPVAPYPADENPNISLPSRVSASCKAGSTSPPLAFDENDSSAWVCHSHGKESVLNIEFNPSTSVSSVSITPGLLYSSQGKTYGLEYRIPSRVIWKLEGKTESGGTISSQRTQDRLVPNIENTITFGRTLTNAKVSLAVFETQPPYGITLPEDAPFAIEQIYIFP